MAKLNRLLIVSQYFWPERFGINDVARRLAEEHIHVDVLTAHPNYPQGDFYPGYGGHSFCQEQVFDIEVFRVPILPRRGAGAVRLILNYLSFVVAALVGGPWKLRGRVYDVVFCYLPSPIIAAIPALWFARIRKKKVVIWVQDLWPGSTATLTKSENSIMQRSLKGLVRWIYRQSDLILISSPAFAEPIAEVLSRNTQIGKIRYLPNSFDPRIVESEDREEIALPHFQASFPIVFAGNIGRAQAVDTIIAAARLVADLRDVHFYLVGGGSMVEYARQKIRSLNISNITLSGQYPTYLMPALLAQAASLLVTLSREEVFRHTLPSKVQAYLHAGKPILAAVNGETARVIEDAGCGVVAPAEDAPALANAIRYLTDLPMADRKTMGDNGAVYFSKHYHPESVSLRLKDLLESQI